MCVDMKKKNVILHINVQVACINFETFVHCYRNSLFLNPRILPTHLKIMFQVIVDIGNMLPCTLWINDSKRVSIVIRIVSFYIRFLITYVASLYKIGVLRTNKQLTSHLSTENNMKWFSNLVVLIMLICFYLFYRYWMVECIGCVKSCTLWEWSFPRVMDKDPHVCRGQSRGQRSYSLCVQCYTKTTL